MSAPSPSSPRKDAGSLSPDRKKFKYDAISASLSSSMAAPLPTTAATAMIVEQYSSKRKLPSVSDDEESVANPSKICKKAPSAGDSDVESLEAQAPSSREESFASSDKENLPEPEPEDVVDEPVVREEDQVKYVVPDHFHTAEEHERDDSKKRAHLDKLLKGISKSRRVEAESKPSSQESVASSTATITSVDEPLGSTTTSPPLATSSLPLPSVNPLLPSSNPLLTVQTTTSLSTPISSVLPAISSTSPVAPVTAQPTIAIAEPKKEEPQPVAPLLSSNPLSSSTPLPTSNPLLASNPLLKTSPPMSSTNPLTNFTLTPATPAPQPAQPAQAAVTPTINPSAQPALTFNFAASPQLPTLMNAGMPGGSSLAGGGMFTVGTGAGAQAKKQPTRRLGGRSRR